jgi:enamine deaminase RidA (YjgF/YER057c/UK114 family)
VLIERQTELILARMKLCLETAGASLQNAMKCNIYLHLGQALRGRQCDLSALLSGKSACAHIRLRAGMDRAV